MRGLVYRGPREISVETVPDPRVPDELGAVVRLTATGICGSDLHAYGGHGFGDDTGYCLGHEGVGEVVEVGAAVRRFAVGDRVLLPASTGCVWCEPCSRGVTAGCAHRRESWKVFGYGLGHLLPGCQAEAVAVPHADVNMV